MDIHAALEQLGISCPTIHHNAPPASLYAHAIAEGDSQIASTGALMARSGKYTGRTPKDKRVVVEPTTQSDVWWGPVNTELSEASFMANRERATQFLSGRDHLYVVDGYVCWEPEYRVKVRIIAARAYHALFMYNMMIRPSQAELAEFGAPDWVVLNAGQCEADPTVEGVEGDASVALHFDRREQVILGTQYAGEMKKGLFTVLNYLLPKGGDFPMHCSANEGTAGDTALFFGLSGTGKTTLSADPNRRLIGDDEHGWWKGGIFNFEGGCYAKTIKLSKEGEPEIWNAIRFGSVLENVVYDERTHAVDYDSAAITQNTRVSYPVEFIDNAKIPCTGSHPRSVVFLTCDAFGVLPPVARLTPAQAQYHFISGYTAKVAGTEAGVTEPEATFSSCFGAPFLVWHPTKYAALLEEKVSEHDATVWFINTGWTGGPFGVGHRIPLRHTRAIVTAILDGRLAEASFSPEPYFGLQVPDACPDVPSELLRPQGTWADPAAYAAKAEELASLFHTNFAQYAEQAADAVRDAAPVICRA